MFSLTDARDAIMTASDPSEENKKQKSGDGEDKIEELRDMSNLRRSVERSLSALERVKSIC